MLNLLFLSLFFLNIKSLDIILVPHDINSIQKDFFYKDGLWDILKKRVEQEGHKLFLYSDKKSGDILVDFNDHNVPNINSFNKKILYLFEPPSVAPDQYLKTKHVVFDKVLTWQDDLVDDQKYLKFFLPQYIAIEPNLCVFSEKKFCVIMIYNKTSYHKDELYTKRIEIIKFFEQNFKDELDFYGFNWPKNIFKCYKGPIDDKIEALKKYKYLICYENMTNINGFVPKNCFIDRRDFKSDIDLYNYLKNITESDYNTYLNNARIFMNSEKAALFSWESFISIFLTVLKNIY